MAYYYMLNKPAGYISAVRDALRPTVIDLLGGEIGASLHPVGRLDRDTHGLLLLTDDGYVDDALLHPRRHVEKTYFLCAFGQIDGEKRKALETGILLPNEELPTRPAVIRSLTPSTVSALSDYLPDNKKRKALRNPGGAAFTMELCIKEGRWHQVKRMLTAVGCKVFYLRRTEMGGIVLDPALAEGAYRPLTESEIALLDARKAEAKKQKEADWSAFSE